MGNRGPLDGVPGPCPHPPRQGSDSLQVLVLQCPSLPPSLPGLVRARRPSRDTGCGQYEGCPALGGAGTCPGACGDWAPCVTAGRARGMGQRGGLLTLRGHRWLEWGARTHPAGPCGWGRPPGMPLNPPGAGTGTWGAAESKTGLQMAALPELGQCAAPSRGDVTQGLRMARPLGLDPGSPTGTREGQPGSLLPAAQLGTLSSQAPELYGVRGAGQLKAGPLSVQQPTRQKSSTCGGQSPGTG